MTTSASKARDVGDSLTGAASVVAYYGHWPSFHDAEVLELPLKREGSSRIRIHCWNISRELDLQGHYVLSQHAVITFELEGIVDLELSDFSPQNVIFGLHVDRTEEEHIRLTLSPCYGVAGYVTAESVSVSLTPGPPAPNLYTPR